MPGPFVCLLPLGAQVLGTLPSCVLVGFAAFLARAEPHADTVHTVPWPFYVLLATLQGRGPPWRADVLEGAWLNPVPDKSLT